MYRRTNSELRDMLDDQIAADERGRQHAWSREFATYGGRERVLDFHTLIALRYALRAINLVRYADNPELKAAVVHARDAVDDCIDYILIDRHERSRSA